MILSVGGSPGPIIASVNAQRPERVCFFVSPGSRPAIDDAILPGLDYRPLHHDWIETPDAEDLLACYRVLARELPRLSEKWRVPLAQFSVDYTGGTKTMSVALALATVRDATRYSYVAGTERTKAGLGVVVDGKERTLHQVNPWDALAVSARERAALMFDRGRYSAAAGEFEEVAARTSTGERSLYQALADLARGYAEWDRFAHSEAQKYLFKALKVLEPFAIGTGEPEWADLVERARQHAEILRELATGRESRLLVADLIANARRRGDIEARYDDAVARLYSALEAAARHRLAERHGIKTSAVEPGQIPEALRDDFCRRYMAPQGILKLPLHASLMLLSGLGDDLGDRHRRREKEIGSLLDVRNASILAHGGRPVSEELYRRLFALVLEVAGIAEADLYAFPRLPR